MMQQKRHCKNPVSFDETGIVLLLLINSCTPNPYS
jgi:hypothetical protein